MAGEIVFTQGSALIVEFKLTNFVEVPTEAKIVIKNDLSDADADAILELTITQAANEEAGVIDVSGTKPVLRFLFIEEHTQLLTVGARLFSAVKMTGESGNPWSPVDARRAVRVLSQGVEAI